MSKVALFSISVIIPPAIDTKDKLEELKNDAIITLKEEIIKQGFIPTNTPPNIDFAKSIALCKSPEYKSSTCPLTKTTPSKDKCTKCSLFEEIEAPVLIIDMFGKLKE